MTIFIYAKLQPPSPILKSSVVLLFFNTKSNCLNSMYKISTLSNFLFLSSFLILGIEKNRGMSSQGCRVSEEGYWLFLVASNWWQFSVDVAQQNHDVANSFSITQSHKIWKKYHWHKDCQWRYTFSLEIPTSSASSRVLFQLFLGWQLHGDVQNEFHL